MEEITQKLFEYRDDTYKQFSAKLMPTVDPDTIIGVKTPRLREIAIWVRKNDYLDFLTELPHKYFEENNLHAFILERVKDYDECLALVNSFLPYVDNWATCDQLNPKVFRDKPQLLDNIKEWIASEHVYTVRFGIGMLMRYFLDKWFTPEYLDLVANIKSKEYYIKMMIAWFFATALSKQYDAALTCLTERKLDKWTHNKAIQKAMESYRITSTQKQHLQTLKRK